MHKILMNTKLKTIINLILCSCSFCSAQITFQKTIGGINSEMGYVIQQTNDGGYISGGTTQSIGAGSVDLYLISTDNNGDTVFTKTYGGTGIDNFGNCMQTADRAKIYCVRAQLGAYLFQGNKGGSLHAPTK